MQKWVVSLSATLHTTCLFPTNCIGLIAELSAEMSQAQHAGPGCWQLPFICPRFAPDAWNCPFITGHVQTASG